MGINFQKAVKYEAKGRVAMIGPAGSGKSYSMLILATLLAAGGKIAAIDTEQGSLSKYADLFDFDVCPLRSFSPDNFLDALHQAERAGYAVFCCDSLSHFWMGRDGALEFVDVAKKRSSSRDDMSGWKEFRPHERQMIDAMIASPMHVICTMRTKTDYQEVEVNGKKKRIKVGLAPVQRDGLEYEFDLVGLMDDDNTFIVDKTRCPALSGRALPKPKATDLQVFADWLQGAKPAEQPKPAEKPVQGRWPATEQQTSPRSSQVTQYEVPDSYTGPEIAGNQLAAFVLNVESKMTKQYPPRPFFAIKIAGKVRGTSLLFCWHMSLGEALEKAAGQNCLFEIELTKDYINLEDVIAIGATEYANGVPTRPAQANNSNQANPDITDDDIPF